MIFCRNVTFGMNSQSFFAKTKKNMFFFMKLKISRIDGKFAFDGSRESHCAQRGASTYSKIKLCRVFGSRKQGLPGSPRNRSGTPWWGGLYWTMYIYINDYCWVISFCCFSFRGHLFWLKTQYQVCFCNRSPWLGSQTASQAFPKECASPQHWSSTSFWPSVEADSDLYFFCLYAAFAFTLGETVILALAIHDGPCWFACL